MTLHELIRKGNFDEIATYLQDNPSEILAKEGDSQSTPLHEAVNLKIPSYRIIELLLNTRQEIVNITDSSGNTALHYAVLKEDGATPIQILIQHGANIDLPNTAGATCLYNNIAQIDLKIKQYTHDEKYKTQLLLEKGANSHVLCFGQSLFELITEKDLSMDWWTLLLDFGAGIYTDFSKFTDPENVNFLRFITANQVIIGAQINGKRIDRTTPGFDHAITTVDELITAIREGNQFNVNAFIVSATHLMKMYATDTDLINELTRMIEFLGSYRVKNMESVSIDRLVKNSLFEANKNTISPDLLAKCETREKQLEQQNMRGAVI